MEQLTDLKAIFVDHRTGGLEKKVDCISVFCKFCTYSHKLLVLWHFHGIFFKAENMYFVNSIYIK